MIKQLTVWLKGTLVTEQADTYANKAYLEILLNYFDNASKTILNPSGWYKATDYPYPLKANKMDSTTPHDAYSAFSESAKEAVKECKKNQESLTDDRIREQNLCSHRPASYTRFSHAPTLCPKCGNQDAIRPESSRFLPECCRSAWKTCWKWSQNAISCQDNGSEEWPESRNNERTTQ